MAMIICEKCGQAVSDRVDICPNCGAAMNGTPADVMSRIDTSLKDGEGEESSSSRKSIAVIAAIIAIAIVAMVGYNMYQNHQQEQERIRQREAFVRDSIARVERERQVAEQYRKDSIAAEERAITDGEYYGEVGGSSCVMTIDGKSGSYDMEYDGVERQLRHDSGGTFKAYLKGKYIGEFVGSFNDSTYTGKFVSVKGSSSPFNLAMRNPEEEVVEAVDYDYYGDNDGYSYSEASAETIPGWVLSTEQRIQEDCEELLAMARSGHIHPMNVMTIKQSLERGIPDVVRYYSEQGNQAKVSYYMQLARAADQVFRDLQM